MAQSTGTAPDPAPETPPDRLNVKLNPEAAAALQEIAQRRSISYTEAVRRAIGLLKFVEDEAQQGHRLQVSDGRRVREVVLV